jgi:exodeoxyribonuclease VII small subunit
MDKTSKNISYQKALNDLERILEDLRNEEIDIDHLSTKLKKAYELLKICQDKIDLAELEINKINNTFNKNEKSI